MKNTLHIKYFITNLDALTICDDIVLTMDPEQWKDKKINLETLRTRDCASANLFNVEQEKMLMLTAANQSTIKCSGTSPQIIMIAYDDATILAKEFIAQKVQAYASEYASIIAQADGADFIAEAEALCSTIIYTGTPKSLKTKGCGSIVKEPTEK